MDMTGLVRTGLQLAEGAVARAPFAGDVLPLLAGIERQVVRTVRDHLAQLESDVDPLQVTSAAEVAAERPTQTPTDVLHSLLDRSMYTAPSDSRDALYLSLLQALVPDEARILAALSDGSVYPVIHVGEPGVGTSSTTVLRNASTIGRAAGVSQPQFTPIYLSRMVALGLATIGPEGSTKMYDEYEMLLTDAAVNTALATARRGVRSARVIKRTVRLSELGKELWEAAK